MEARRELLCKGYLRKSPPEQKLERNYKWRKRFFKLWSDKTLEYYKTDEDTRPLKEPLNLASCATVLPCDGKYKKHLKKDYPWLFSLPMPGRCYHFAARTEGEMIVWKREIGKICNFFDESDDENNGNGDDNEAIDEHDGASPVDNSRTASVSSQSHHSTSSTSSKSSPRQWPVHSVSINEATAQLVTSFRTSSVSSSTGSTEQFGYRSPETKPRISSSSPMTSPRTPKSPTNNTRPLYTSSSSFTTSIDGDHNYDILRAPVRGVLEEMPEAHYDVPPPTSHLQHLSYKGRSVSLKQPSTGAKGETGYVDMKPKEDDYLEYENDNESEKVEKEFVSPPWMNQSKAKSLKVQPNTEKILPHKRTNTIALGQQVTLNETIHDEIPDMRDKKLKEVISKEDPPKVQRDKKPPPRVDRRKKPSKQEFLPRQQQQALSDNYKEDVRNGTSAILNQELNNMHLNHHHHTSHDTYLNHCTSTPSTTTTHYNNRRFMRYSNDSSDGDANNYHNLPSSPIRCDANGDRLTVGTHAHINLTIPNCYAWEPLPPNPSSDSEDDALSSPTSPYENSNEVFMNNFHGNGDVSGNYENVESIVKDENSLTYSEVNALMWTQRSTKASQSLTTPPAPSSNGSWIGEQAGSTGTHYVFVDITKSTGLQLSKRSNTQSTVVDSRD